MKAKKKLFLSGKCQLINVKGRKLMKKLENDHFDIITVITGSRTIDVKTTGYVWRAWLA